MILTEADKLIIASYSVMLKGLSDYLGSSYEVILHSLEDYDRSVVSIYNGYLSGRDVGAPITDLALNMLSEIEKEEAVGALSDGPAGRHGRSMTYFVTTDTGRHLKSATIPVIGENRRIIGLVCINRYLDTSLYELVSELVEGPDKEKRSETFSSDADDVITNAVRAARSRVMFDPEIPSSNKNKELIRNLYEQGIFNLKDAVIKVSELLGVSKNTVYMHLRNIKM